MQTLGGRSVRERYVVAVIYIVLTMGAATNLAVYACAPRIDVIISKVLIRSPVYSSRVYLAHLHPGLVNDFIYTDHTQQPATLEPLLDQQFEIKHAVQSS